MLSLLRITTAPLAVKLSPPTPQLSPYSPLTECATFTAVLDANSPAVGTPLDATCHLKEVVNPLSTNTQQPFLSQPLPNGDTDDVVDNSVANPDASPRASCSNFAPDASPCSIFPVYGPFDLLYCIQTGGFGSTWAARDQSTGRLLCLKVFQSVQDPDIFRSARAELNTFRRFVKSGRGEKGKHFIMELNRSTQHGPDVFFAMELMTTDLGSYFCIEPERCKLHARRWMAQIALGIEALHEMEIIHRDIKSENILIDARENIRIIDFGLAYMGSPGKPLCATDFLGTPPYMAPEVLRNEGLLTHRRRPYGMAVDWWALGCILFELESRDHQVLFDTEKDVHAYVAWTQRPCQPEERYQRFEGLDSVIVDLLEGLLQVRPSARYSWNDIENHAYFKCLDGTSEFDDAVLRGVNVPIRLDAHQMIRSDVETVAALQRPICPQLVPQFTGEYEPIKVIEAAKLVAPIFDWTNLKWALAMNT